jgi:hypothetical protein
MIAPEVSTIRGFLAGQGFDFALMLHEDVDETEFYLYGFEKAGTEIAKNIVRLAQRYFKIAANDDTDELPMDENGIISDYQDGSLEHWLSTTGIPAAFCTETPGRLPLELRVEANLQFILFLLNWMRVRESP